MHYGVRRVGLAVWATVVSRVDSDALRVLTCVVWAVLATLACRVDVDALRRFHRLNARKEHEVSRISEPRAGPTKVPPPSCVCPAFSRAPRRGPEEEKEGVGRKDEQHA